jgi:hypothetical protein
MLAVDDLDDTTVERAGALVAREQAVITAWSCPTAGVPPPS